MSANSPTQQQKRLRTSVACSRCRKRKIKCSGESEDGLGCESCRHSGHARQCMFTRVKSTSLPWSEDEIQRSGSSARSLPHMSHQQRFQTGYSHPNHAVPMDSETGTSQTDHGYGYAIPMRSHSHMSTEPYSSSSSIYATPSMTRGGSSPSSSPGSHSEDHKPQPLEFPTRQVITLPVPPPGRQPINSMSTSVTTNHFPRKDGAVQYYNQPTYLQPGEYVAGRTVPSLEGSSSRKISGQYEYYDGQRYGPAPSQ